MSGRYRPAENSLLAKHVVAAGRHARDPGSTPGASTNPLGKSRKQKAESKNGNHGLHRFTQIVEDGGRRTEEEENEKSES